MTVQHEESDVNIRAIFGFGAGLAMVMVAVYLVVRLMFGYFDSREAGLSSPDFPLAAGHEARLPPEPRLQTNPRDDLQQLRQRDEEKLNRYEWVDRSAGVVRIPIGEAMKLTIQRGLPSKPPSTGAK